jgi:hypothetical protein
MNYVRAVPEKYTREGRKALNYVRAVPEKYTREGRKAPNYVRDVPEEYTESVSVHRFLDTRVFFFFKS